MVLSERTKVLLFSGIGANMTEAYEYAWERLYVDEAEEIGRFCSWIDLNVGGCSQYNIDRLYQCFQEPDNPLNIEYYKELAANIAMYK